MENQIIITNVYGIVVNLTGDGGGSITSDLKVNEEEVEDEVEDYYYNCAIDGIESMILGHAIAGIDITTPEYKEGIETAVEACSNNF